MKKQVYTLSLFSLIILAIAGCKKDSDDEKNNFLNTLKKMLFSTFLK